MDKFIIDGGRKLEGTVLVQSAKNSVLPLLAASILTDEQVIIHNMPNISDVICMTQILSELGVDVQYKDGNAIISSVDAATHEISSRLTKELRSSVFMLGSVLTRFSRARIAYPGGCDIGLRPIDLHIAGLKQLGVKITEEEGYINCSAEKLHGADIHFDFPSVGATENIILAAVKAEGTTIIRNAAKEPEIKDLQRFINKMGGKIRGAGTATITIEGVKRLYGIEYSPMKDRIEAGTYLIAGAMCGGEIEVCGCKKENIASLLHKLCENGCKVMVENDKIYLSRKEILRSNRTIETQPFPGFPTDLQAPMLSMNCISQGVCSVTETVFETRFRHVPELIRMGADIVVKDRTAIVRGVPCLHGACVTAEDLRGGAALVLAGLVAEGTTEIYDLLHIDRGYSNFEYKLKELGAKIRRIRV